LLNIGVLRASADEVSVTPQPSRMRSPNFSM
jgi:hypothetical protein